MSGTPWPRVLDMSEDDSRKALRSLELSTYSSIIATFRAQGDLTPQKKTLLHQLQTLFGVSTERHKAEVRRCVNDEKLSTVAFHMVGANHDNEWLIEGRRMAPLVPRPPAQTAYTLAADHLSIKQSEKNSLLPLPSLTGNRENFTAQGSLFSPPPPPSVAQSPTVTSPNLTSPTYAVGTTTPAPVTKYSRAQSPNTNVVVLPSGTSIHIKGGLNLDEDEDITGAKRRRIASTETVATTNKPIVNRGQATTPMKITLSKPALSSAQKVILVSSTGQSISSTASLKSANSTVPIVKSVTPITSHTRTSVVYPANTNTQAGGDNSITAGPSIHTAQGLTLQRPRAKATLTATPRLTGGLTKPTTITVSRPGMVIPVGAQGITTTRTVAGKPGIHIKQEGAMKIITSSGSKLLPKPSTGSTAPIVVVTSAGSSVGGTLVTASTHSGSNTSSAGLSHQSPSTLTRNTVIANSAGAVAISSGKVISINTGKVIGPGGTVVGANQAQQISGKVPVRTVGQGRVIGTPPNQRILGAQTHTVSSVGSVTSQTITTTTGKSGNVVIVQQPTPGRQPATIVKTSAGINEKDLVSFIQKGDVTVKPLKSNLTTSIKSLTAGGSPITMSIKSSDYNKPSILANLIHSAEQQRAAQSISGSASSSSSEAQSHSQIVVTSLPSNRGGAGAANNTTSGTSAWITSSSGSSSSNVPTIISAQASGAEANQSTSDPPKIDIFSSALAEAQINLDPYEFIDEDEPVVASSVNTPTSWTDGMPIWSSSGDNATFHVSQAEAILSGEIPFIPPQDSDMHDKTGGGGSGSILDAGLDKATSLLAQANSMLAQTSDRRTPTPTLPNLAPTPPPSSSPQQSSGTQSILANNASGQTILPKGKEPIRILPAISISHNHVGSSGGSITITAKQAIQPQKTWSLTNTTVNTSKSIELQPKVLKIERTISQPAVRTAVTTVTSVTTTTPSISATGATSGDISPSPLIDTKILILPPGIGQPTTPVKDNKPIVQSVTDAPGTGVKLANQMDTKIASNPSSHPKQKEPTAAVNSLVKKFVKEQATTVIMTVQDVLPSNNVPNKNTVLPGSSVAGRGAGLSSHPPNSSNITESAKHLVTQESTISEQFGDKDNDLTVSQHFTSQLESGKAAMMSNESHVDTKQTVTQELIDQKSSDSESFQDLVSDLVSMEQIVTQNSDVSPSEGNDIVTLGLENTESIADSVLLDTSSASSETLPANDGSNVTSKQTAPSDSVTLKASSENLQSKNSKNLDTLMQSELNTLPNSAIANESELPQILEPEKPDPTASDKTMKLGAKSINRHPSIDPKTFSKADISLPMVSDAKSKVHESLTDISLSQSANNDRAGKTFNQNSTAASKPLSSLLKESTDSDVELPPDTDLELSPPLIARKYDKVYRPRNGRNSVTANNLNAEIKTQPAIIDKPVVNTVSTGNGSSLSEVVTNNSSSVAPKVVPDTTPPISSPANNTEASNDQAKSTSSPLPTELPNSTEPAQPDIKYEDGDKDQAPAPSTLPSKLSKTPDEEDGNKRQDPASSTPPTKPSAELRPPLLVLQKSPVKETTPCAVNGMSESAVTDVTAKRHSTDGSGDGQLPQPEEDNSNDWLADSGHSMASSNGPRNTDNMSGGEDDSGPDDDENSNDMSGQVLSPSGDSSAPLKLSSVNRGKKRRRKSDTGLSWAKAAMGLLRRVMMFRGANRNKGEHGAAAWFLKPVSDDEAPGYSDIITTPMDFGTVERKLKANQYNTLEEFRSDMLLIYTNCCSYNPPEHNVRRDCEQVFVFFNLEYEKVTTKLQQATESKKAKLEALSSPVISPS